MPFCPVDIRLPWRLWATSSYTWPTTASTRRTPSTRATVTTRPARDTNGNRNRWLQSYYLPPNSFKPCVLLGEFSCPRGIFSTLIWPSLSLWHQKAPFTFYPGPCNGNLWLMLKSDTAQNWHIHGCGKKKKSFQSLVVLTMSQLVSFPFSVVCVFLCVCRALKALWQYLGASGVNTTLIWEKIKDIVIKTIIAWVSFTSCAFDISLFVVMSWPNA